MKIDVYDKVILKTGEVAYIVEILGDGKCFVADIDYADGTSTDFIYPKDILQVIKMESEISKTA